MTSDTFRVITASYRDIETARRDLHQVHQLWTGAPFGDSYETAVISRDDEGKVDVVDRHSEPIVADAGAGLATGLAVGVALALFPAIGLGAGLLMGGAAGAGLGALSGHLTGHLSNRDLAELGEVLSEGDAGLIVAIRNPSRSVYPLLRHATTIIGRDVPVPD